MFNAVEDIAWSISAKKDTNSFLLLMEMLLMACSSVLGLAVVALAKAKANYTIKSVGSFSGNVGSSSNTRFFIVCVPLTPLAFRSRNFC